MECYLCVSYAPGKPITGLVLCNEEEDYILFNDYKKLDLSVSGFNANLNGESNGDPLYLAYRGGAGSCFGHSKGLSVYFIFSFSNHYSIVIFGRKISLSLHCTYP